MLIFQFLHRYALGERDSADLGKFPQDSNGRYEGTEIEIRGAGLNASSIP